MDKRSLEIDANKIINKLTQRIGDLERQNAILECSVEAVEKQLSESQQEAEEK